MRFLAREKRRGLAACLLRTCVIGGGGVVALSEADLVIRSSHARLGVLRPGHVVACIRITSHELLRDGVRAVAAFLFGRPHRDGFLSGSFSSFPRHLACQPDSAKKAGQRRPWRRPRRGPRHGLGARSTQLPSRLVARCRRVPAPAYPPKGRLRQAHRDMA